MTEEAKALQKLAREQMKRKLLADIIADLTICKLENEDPKEYIEDLKNEIDKIAEQFRERTKT